MRPFIRQEDAHLRLDQTIVMYRGVPMWCQVSNNFPVNHVHVSHLTNIQAGLQEVDITSDEFHANIPELGYINLNTNCDYLSRLPERRQRQGLCVDTVQAFRGVASVRHMFFSQSMVNLLTNTYPTLDECIRRINIQEWDSCAFHKYVAVTRRWNKDNFDIALEYRCRDVATYDQDLNRFTLKNDMKDGSFLTEILQDLGIRV